MTTTLFGFALPTLLIASVAAAAALVYLPFLVVAYGRVVAGYDMAAPRAMFDRLPPFAQRATWAHQNALEAFALFTAAALMSYVTRVDTPVAAWAAVGFVVARLFYPVFYIANIPVARSLMFALGSTCIGTLMVLSIQRTLG